MSKQDQDLIELVREVRSINQALRGIINAYTQGLPESVRLSKRENFEEDLKKHNEKLNQLSTLKNLFRTVVSRSFKDLEPKVEETNILENKYLALKLISSYVVELEFDEELESAEALKKIKALVKGSKGKPSGEKVGEVQAGLDKTMALKMELEMSKNREKKLEEDLSILNIDVDSKEKLVETMEAGLNEYEAKTKSQLSSLLSTWKEKLDRIVKRSNALARISQRFGDYARNLNSQEETLDSEGHFTASWYSLALQDSKDRMENDFSMVNTMGRITNISSEQMIEGILDTDIEPELIEEETN